MPDAPFLKRVALAPGKTPDTGEYPFSLPFVRTLDVAFTSAVTFFVGENGSGKSTLIEAIADACELPVSGGSRNESADRHGPERRSALGDVLRWSFSRRPRDGYFFRAEFQAHFASLLDQRRDDPDFDQHPYRRYGGRSLHSQSHGEAYLAAATHSPILLTYPGAEILSFDVTPIRPVTLEETSHYRITRGILEEPERYWRLLGRDNATPPA